MQTQQIAEWLTTWVREHGKLAETAIPAEANFLEEGWVDSVSIIQLIYAVEQEFGIRFNEDHFSNPSFPTVGGLAGIIAAERSDASNRPGPRR